MTPLVAYVMLFLAVGAGFILVNLLVGKLLRPARPDPEKQTIYECGEPTIGSAWIQFDLRFYVIALLFVIFDVEVAFFFPWAEIFGKANSLANSGTAGPNGVASYKEVGQKAFDLTPSGQDQAYRQRYARMADMSEEAFQNLQKGPAAPRVQTENAFKDAKKEAGTLAWLAFWDIFVFFGVLLVGFAYLWRRGDLAWVRSVAAERETPAATPASEVRAPALAGSSRSL